MTITEAHDPRSWDGFLASQPWSPFLQSWTMGEVYKDIGEEPVRLELRENGLIVGICFGVIVPARRGRHLAVMYGPVVSSDIGRRTSDLGVLWNALRDVAHDHRCSFIRLSPFLPKESAPTIPEALSAPLHLLAEHIWYIDLRGKSEDMILKGMRQNHRNLIRRTEREGVTVEASCDLEADLAHFFRLYEETRRRHHFVPYSEAFIRSQVRHFGTRKECTLYLARYRGDVIAASVHMHVFGETSYHHGASSSQHSKIPASYALQWKALRDAVQRGDRVFNLWGIAPVRRGQDLSHTDAHPKGPDPTHPFVGVTTFKMGFGGQLLELMHCVDIPVTKKYHVTRAFEKLRKWKRGF